jgi:hypothetical protein
MRLNVPPGKTTYPLAISLWIKPIDLWTLRGVTDSLQDGGLSGVRSPNNENSELELDVAGSSGRVPIVPGQLGRDVTHPLTTMVERRRLVRGLNTLEIVGSLRLLAEDCGVRCES